MKEFTFDNLVEVMREVFNASGVVIDENSTSASVPGWDSIAHVILMLEIEDVFGFTMTPQEAAESANVGELYRALAARRP